MTTRSRGTNRWILATALTAALVVSTRGVEAQSTEGAGGVGCPGTESCCQAHVSPGCDDSSCCATVCLVDLICCDAEWDDICVGIAENVCPLCASGCGDGNCDGDETCETCSSDCGVCPNACAGAVGDCCADNDTPGCDDTTCCETVCEVDVLCCDAAWDAVCATIAASVCPFCGSECGDGTCDTDEDCAKCPSDCGVCPDACISAEGDCCANNGTAGCDDLSCCAVVCAADSFCCDNAWDAVCASLAASLCPTCSPVCGDAVCDGNETCDSCPEDCGTCPSFCPGDGDCCRANGSPSCDDSACCARVCGIDPTCCENVWDEVCAQVAVSVCPSLQCGGACCLPIGATNGRAGVQGPVSSLEDPLTWQQANKPHATSGPRSSAGEVPHRINSLRYLAGLSAGEDCMQAAEGYCATVLGGTYGGDGTLCTDPDICVCGNGLLDPGEVCDDGFIDACGTCNEDCSGFGGGATCGDANVCPETEECDEGALNSDEPDATCRTDCSDAGCGDGILDTAEDCDEGASNSNAPDATCRTNCVIGGCGDGIEDSDETCDDGNNSDCDGCRGDCSATETGCGDAFLCNAEVCDDGNTDDCDGCRGDCSATETGCGDGFVCLSEECDEGLSNSDEPDATCRTDCTFGRCSDGILDSSETCDDGNNDDCDGCRGDCSGVETGCGDGFLCGLEECDDGDVEPGNGCDENCLTEECLQVAGLIASSYACDESLSRVGNNVLRFTFDTDLSDIPGTAGIEIRELLEGGQFGEDISGQFDISIEGSNVLKVVEPGQVFVNQTWYAVMNRGEWCGSQEFKLLYPVVYGDANNDHLTAFIDLLAIQVNKVSLQDTPDDSRFDINTKGGVSFSDLSAANTFISAVLFMAGQPSGHSCAD